MSDEARQPLPSKLRLIREDRGFSLQDLADLIGTTNQQLSHLELGKRKLTQDWLRRLARALDTTAADILGEPGWSLKRASDRHWEKGEFVLEARVLNTPPAEPALVEFSGQRFVPIPVYAATASAGPGSDVEHDRVRHHIIFREDWLRRIAAPPFARVMAVGIVGDSMEPTLRDGDTVLIDTAVRAPREDAIYVLRYDGLLQAKRIRTDPVSRTITIISENPLYPPLANVRAADIRIAGRVIWIGRKV